MATSQWARMSDPTRENPAIAPIQHLSQARRVRNGPLTHQKPKANDNSRTPYKPPARQTWASAVAHTMCGPRSEKLCMGAVCGPRYRAEASQLPSSQSPVLVMSIYDDHHIRSSCMIVITMYDGHICPSYMMTICDDHILYVNHIRSSCVVIVYGRRI